MSHDFAPAPEHDEERELFVMGNQGCTNIRTWKLTITPDEVTITPAETAWGCIVGFNVFCLLFAVGFGCLALMYVDKELKMLFVVMDIWTMLLIATVVTTLTVRQFRSDQGQGPWLVVNRPLRRVSLPRHGVEVPIEQVDHLQAITGTEYQQISWSESEMSELNIVLREGDRCRRYNLLSCTGHGEFNAMARTIAKLNLLPVKRIVSVWDPRKTTQKWLTPEGGFKSE